MPRRPAAPPLSPKPTSRAIRAAKQTGAAEVELDFLESIVA